MRIIWKVLSHTKILDLLPTSHLCMRLTSTEIKTEISISLSSFITGVCYHSSSFWVSFRAFWMTLIYIYIYIYIYIFFFSLSLILMQTSFREGSKISYCSESLLVKVQPWLILLDPVQPRINWNIMHPSQAQESYDTKSIFKWSTASFIPKLFFLLV